MVDDDKESISVREAGRRGGTKVRDKYGRDYYVRLGRKGGETVKKERGVGFYSQIGKKGGSKERDKAD